MPLCDKIRLDAGRPFIKTLIARIYVALFLLAVVAMVTHKNPLNLNKYDLFIGKNESSVQNTQPVDKNLFAINDTKNDKYGR